MLGSPRSVDGYQVGRLESPVSSARAFRDTLDQLVQQRQNKGSGSSASNSNDSSSSSNVKARSQAAIVREAKQQLAAAGIGAGAGVNGEPVYPFQVQERCMHVRCAHRVDASSEQLEADADALLRCRPPP
jgi:hypothetical protein